MTPGQLAYTNPQAGDANCIWDIQFPKAERERRNDSPRNRLLKGATSIVPCIVRVNDYFPSISVRATLCETLA